MIPLRSEADIQAMARAGRVLGHVFDAIDGQITPGTTTQRIDEMVEEAIRSHEGAEPAFLGLYGFPASACVSVNEEVVHGIPDPRRMLEPGDIVTVDVGVVLDGWYSDSARTYPVGEPDEAISRLLNATRTALERGIAQAEPGNRLGDIGHAIETTAREAGFRIVRDLVGHGVGRAPHEEPQVPNFGRPGTGLRLREGMVLAIEPMFSAGSADIRTLDDGWTVTTADAGRAAHFEHTVAILGDGPRILTANGRESAARGVDLRAVG